VRAERFAGMVRSAPPAVTSMRADTRQRSTIAIAALALLGLLSWQIPSSQGRTAMDLDRGESTSPLPTGGTTIGFWAGESVPGTSWGSPDTYWKRRSTRLYTPYMWDVLRTYRIPLYLNLRYRRDFGPVPPGMPRRRDGLAIVRQANRMGVPIWGWVLVPFTSGYWAWNGSAAEHFDAVKELVRWTRAKGVHLEGLVIDPEPPATTSGGPFAAFLRGGEGTTLPDLFQQAIDPAGQCSAWNTYARMARWARSRRIDLAAAPLAMALDDLGDGSLALQDAAEFSVPPGPWHELYFQAYRSVFAYHGGSDPGSGIVSSYLRSARQAFGRAAQVSLGSAGRGPYKRLSRLVHDVRLAATLGARNLPIYSLERTLSAYGGPRSLIRLARAAKRPFTGAQARTATAPTVRADAARAALRAADVAATAATPNVTASRGSPQAPNAWPGGCRSWTVVSP